MSIISLIKCSFLNGWNTFRSNQKHVRVKIYVLIENVFSNNCASQLVLNAHLC